MQESLQLDQLETMIHEKTRLIAVMHVSNALGTINPVEADHSTGTPA